MTSPTTQAISFAPDFSADDVSGGQSESSRRLDRLPVGSFHYRIITIIGAGLLVESFENMLASSVLAALQKEGWTTLHLTSIFLSVTFAGLLIGGWMAGMLGDHFGRKKGYQINLLIFGISGMAAFVAPNMYFLIAVRFLMGLGIGSELVLGCSTLAEFLPPNKRGRLFAGMSIITHSGGFIASTCAAWVIPHWGWRYMFLIAALSAVVVWFMRRYMPESPRWLESKGRVEEARAVLDQIEAITYRGEKPPPLAAVRNVSPARLRETPVQSAKLWDLFSAKYIKGTVVGFLVMITMQICFYGLVTWIPTFFVAQGHSMEEALRWNAIVLFAQPVTGILLIFIVDKIGRKALLTISSILAVGFSLIYLASNDQPIFMLLAVGFVFVMLSEILMTVGQGVYLSEIFPTKLRSRGVGVVSSASRGLMIGVQALIPAIFSLYKVTGIMIAVDVVMLIFIAVLLTLGTETKGRSLEDIAH